MGMLAQGPTQLKFKYIPVTQLIRSVYSITVYGVGHVNILPGLSNGLELLQIFPKHDEQDTFDNPVLKDGDLIVMDNCGFHHAGHVEPRLRDMLANRGVTRIYQPPYHPQYNTCEICFRHLKGFS